MDPLLSLSANELVEIVDEHNNVLEPRRRHEMRSMRLTHRATYAFVKNSCNFFYVQKRSNIKDYCPSYFDANPGGVVAAGESYDITNKRELEEEMGIPQSVESSYLFTFYYEDHRIKCFGGAFEVVYDGPMKLQVEEVESIHLMSMEEIFDNADKFTPDSIYACRLYVEKYGIPVTSGEKVDLIISQ